MVNHFKEIYDECQVPILIYNVVPWCYLSPDLLIKLWMRFLGFWALNKVREI